MQCARLRRSVTSGELHVSPCRSLLIGRRSRKSCTLRGVSSGRRTLNSGCRSASGRMAETYEGPVDASSGGAAAVMLTRCAAPPCRLNEPHGVWVTEPVLAPFVFVDPFVSVSRIVDACTGARHSRATPAKTTWSTDTNGWTDTNGALRMTTRANVVLQPVLRGVTQAT